MKCDENGGCPFRDNSGEFDCAPVRFLDEHDCHLTPASFPRLRAEIAGEWACSKCKYGRFQENTVTGTCWLLRTEGKGYFVRCAGWQPTDIEGEDK